MTRSIRLPTLLVLGALAVPALASPLVAETAAPQPSKTEQTVSQPVRFFGDSADDFARARPQLAGEWLVMSNGGADGAFGAGYLVGRSIVGKRPSFSMVTGVSAGALVAPFAFLGSERDPLLRELFTGIDATDVFEVSSTKLSLLDTWPLKELVEKHVTADLLRDIATEHRKGRRLLVVTTELSSGRPVVWNMGAIAEAGTADSLALFRNILLASTSIPGLFPPVKIDDDGKPEWHVDGAVTMPFYLTPGFDLSVGNNLIERVLLLVNGKLTPQSVEIKPALVPMLGRSISVAATAFTRLYVEQAKLWVERNHVAMDVVSIRPELDAVARGPFDTHYMKALFDEGLRRAQEQDAGLVSASDPR